MSYGHDSGEIRDVVLGERPWVEKRVLGSSPKDDSHTPPTASEYVRADGSINGSSPSGPIGKTRAQGTFHTTAVGHRVSGGTQSSRSPFTDSGIGVVGHQVDRMPRARFEDDL